MSEDVGSHAPNADLLYRISARKIWWRGNTVDVKAVCSSGGNCEALHSGRRRSCNKRTGAAASTAVPTDGRGTVLPGVAESCQLHRLEARAPCG